MASTARSQRCQTFDGGFHAPLGKSLVSTDASRAAICVLVLRSVRFIERFSSTRRHLTVSHLPPHAPPSIDTLQARVDPEAPPAAGDNTRGVIALKLLEG